MICTRERSLTHSIRNFHAKAGYSDRLLVVTCLYLGDCWQGTAASTRYVTRWYRLYVETILFWSVLFPPFSLLSMCLRSPDGKVTSGQIAAVVIYCFGVIALTVTLRQLTTFVRAGIAWSLVFLTCGFSSLAFGANVNVSVLAKLYCVVQVIGGTLLLLSTVDVLLSHHGALRPWRTRFARIGFLTIPMLFVASVGPVLIAGCSTMVPLEADGALTATACDWCTQFNHGFEKWYAYDVFAYDFAISELLMTITVAAIPVLGIVGVVLYGLVRTGTFARSWLFFLLVASPAIFMLNSLAFFLLRSCPEMVAAIDWYVLETYRWNVLETYRVSALRVLPFLPFLIGPLLIILDIAGDIAFYVLPETHPLSSRATTKGRLSALLAQIGPKIQGYTVYAHSQGSVIAADTLSDLRDPRATLVTLGSPIASLYESFLDIKPGLWIAGTHQRWINFFRVGDYIGGSISRANVDRAIGPGGHTNYWDDPAFKQALDAAEMASNNCVGDRGGPRGH